MLRPLLHTALGRSLLLRTARPPATVVANARLAALSHTVNTNKMSLLARRTFFTTAHVEEPAAAGKKATATKAKSTTTAKAKGTKPKATKKPAKKTAAKKVAAKPKKVVRRRKVAAKPKPVKYQLKDLKPPFKMPASSFAAFSAEWYKSHDAKGSIVVERIPEVVAAWGNLSQTEKEAYRPSPEAVAEYYAKKKEWYKDQPMGVRRAIKKRSRSKRVPRPNSPYMHFIKEFFKDRAPELEGLTFAEKAKKISAEFQTLSGSEKETLKQRALQEFEAAQATKAEAMA